MPPLHRRVEDAPGPGAEAPFVDGGSAGKDVRRRRVAGTEERLRGRAERAIAKRRVFRFLAGAMLVLSLGAGVLVWLIDRRDFHTVGDGVWWALVTLATVGYGDIVPHTTWGRVVGSVVIVMGVTFLSFLTATVTSYFVSVDQHAQAAEVEAIRGADEDETQKLLREVLAELRTMNERLSRGTDAQPPAP